MFETAETGASIQKDDFERRAPELRVELVNAQYDLMSADFPVILVLDGDDWRGIQDILDGVNDWMDTRYLRIHAMDYSREEDRLRPAFFPFWRCLPGKGETAIFANAWSAGGVRARLMGELDAEQFENHLLQIRRFERDQVSEGALLLKFWLHLPKKELKKSIKKAGRGKNSRGAWKLSPGADVLYDNYDDMIRYSERLIEQTGEAGSPWQIIESTDWRYAGLQVGETIVRSIRERLDHPQPPLAPPPNASVPPGGAPSILGTVDLSKKLERDDYKKSLDKLQARISRLTQQAYEKGVSSVFVFEGWDAAGKGGVIRRLVRGTDIRHTRVVPIAAPTDEELAHHYLWRFWRKLPRPGEMVVFDRSWYGRVLVERVEELASKEAWSRAYSEINHFEQQLTDAGWVVLKFWLHIDPDEQLSRFEAREKTAYKKYKITEEDYRNRDKWEAYSHAVDEMVARTSTNLSPWHLIPANDKPYARVSVLKTVCQAFKERLG